MFYDTSMLKSLPLKEFSRRTKKNPIEIIFQGHKIVAAVWLIKKLAIQGVQASLKYFAQYTLFEIFIFCPKIQL